MKNRSVALVAGGTGGIGEGVVKVLVESGWDVYVPLRPGDTGERLKEYLLPATAILLPCDLAIGSSVRAMREKIQSDAGRLDLVVVGVGSSYYGYSLQRIPESDWTRLMIENLSTHFHLQQEFLGWLREKNSGTYITLTGPEADFVQPDSGIASIIAGAQKMMARVESLEASDGDVCVYSVTSKHPIATRSRGSQVSSDWLKPEDLGRYVTQLHEKHPDSVVHFLDGKL